MPRYALKATRYRYTQSSRDMKTRRYHDNNICRFVSYLLETGLHPRSQYATWISGNDVLGRRQMVYMTHGRNHIFHHWQMVGTYFNRQMVDWHMVDASTISKVMKTSY